jgi:hypothetical protein
LSARDAADSSSAGIELADLHGVLHTGSLPARQASRERALDPNRLVLRPRRPAAPVAVEIAQRPKPQLRMIEVDLEAIAPWTADGDGVAGEDLPSHRVGVKAGPLTNPETAGDVPGDRRDLQRGPRQVTAPDIDAVADQRPAPPQDPSRTSAEPHRPQMHQSHARELAAVKLAGDDGDEVQIASPTRNALMHAEPTT